MKCLGVSRAAAANAYGQIATSIVSAEYPGRGEALDRIANAKEIPALEDLKSYGLHYKLK